jgi:hypothetical protein
VSRAAISDRPRSRNEISADVALMFRTLASFKLSPPLIAADDCLKGDCHFRRAERLIAKRIDLQTIVCNRLYAISLSE